MEKWTFKPISRLVSELGSAKEEAYCDEDYFFLIPKTSNFISCTRGWGDILFLFWTNIYRIRESDGMR